MRAAILGLLFLAASSKPASRALPSVVNDGHGDYVYVPAGAFKMGDNFGDGESRERPVHVVELDAFYISKYETTNGEWKKFLNDPGYDDPKVWPGGRVVPKDQNPYWNDVKITVGARLIATTIQRSASTGTRLSPTATG